jgi:hypothetical protein
MSSRRPLSVFLAAFLVGGVIGYASVSYTQPQADGVGMQVDHREDGVTRAVRDERDGASRSTRPRRDTTGSIRLDEKGRYLLPASLAGRLQCMALSGMKVNRSELAILGFSDQELDQLQELLTEICEKCFSRETAMVKDFTRGEKELIRMIPGDQVFAESLREDVEERIRRIAGGKAALLESRMISELESLTMDFGRSDYYLRVGRSESAENRLEIESIRISQPMTEGIEMPEPGDSFQDYRSRYRYGAQRRYGYGGEVPEFLRHLITEEDCESLLPAR